MKCPRCGSEMREKRHKGHRRSFYECPNCHYNLTKMRELLSPSPYARAVAKHIIFSVVRQKPQTNSCIHAFNKAYVRLLYQTNIDGLWGARKKNSFLSLCNQNGFETLVARALHYPDDWDLS